MRTSKNPSSMNLSRTLADIFVEISYCALVTKIDTMNRGQRLNSIISECAQNLSLAFPRDSWQFVSARRVALELTSTNGKFQSFFGAFVCRWIGVLILTKQGFRNIPGHLCYLRILSVSYPLTFGDVLYLLLRVNKWRSYQLKRLAT